MSYINSLKRSNEGCSPKLSLRLMMFEEGFSFNLFGFFIPLPFLQRFLYKPKEIMENWGFYWMYRSLVLCWSYKTKSIRMPWDHEHIGVQVQRPDGSWVKEIPPWDNKGDDGRLYQTFPYHYVCKNGDIQDVEAKVNTERREWRWRIFRHFRVPFTYIVKESIEVEFSEEVGDRRGSWKGGCVGAGHTKLKGETTEQCLKRMEKERIFR